MPPYERHVFVCTNVREPGNPKGCCAAKGAEQVRERLRDAVAAAGLKRTVRINAAGCLDQCAHGVAVVVYPEGIWYGGVTPEDADEIFQSHIVAGRPVARLRLPNLRPVE